MDLVAGLVTWKYHMYINRNFRDGFLAGPTPRS